MDTYLCSIAHNLFVSMLRRQGKNISGAVPETMPSSENIEQGFESRDTARQLQLHRLEDPYKEIFTLRAFGELSFAEIGALFGNGESWTRVIDFRARQKLQGMLKEEENHI